MPHPTARHSAARGQRGQEPAFRIQLHKNKTKPNHPACSPQARAARATPSRPRGTRVTAGTDVANIKNHEKRTHSTGLRHLSPGHDGICNDGHPARHSARTGHNNHPGRPPYLGLRHRSVLRRPAADGGPQVQSEAHTARTGRHDAAGSGALRRLANLRDDACRPFHSRIAPRGLLRRGLDSGHQAGRRAPQDGRRVDNGGPG